MTDEINFEVCQNCNKHSWCTHHDEKKYHSLFEEIKIAIESSQPGVTCVKNKTTQNPSIGAFELTHKGIIIFSKKSTGLFPSPAPTAERVAQFLDDLKNGRDVTTYLSKQEKKYEAPKKQKERPTFESYKKLKEEEDQNKTQQNQQKEQKQQKQQHHSEEEQQQEQQDDEPQQSHEHHESPQKSAHHVEVKVEPHVEQVAANHHQPAVEQAPQAESHGRAEQEKVDDGVGEAKVEDKPVQE